MPYAIYVRHRHVEQEGFVFLLLLLICAVCCVLLDWKRTGPVAAARLKLSVVVDWVSVACDGNCLGRNTTDRRRRHSARPRNTLDAPFYSIKIVPTSSPVTISGRSGGRYCSDHEDTQSASA